MTDYDPNLPQEFGHMPKRRRAGVLIIALALVAAFLSSALIARNHVQAPASEKTASEQQQAESGTATPQGGQ